MKRAGAGTKVACIATVASRCPQNALSVKCSSPPTPIKEGGYNKFLIQKPSSRSSYIFTLHRRFEKAYKGLKGGIGHTVVGRITEDSDVLDGSSVIRAMAGIRHSWGNVFYYRKRVTKGLSREAYVYVSHRPRWCTGAHVSSIRTREMEAVRAQ